MICNRQASIPEGTEIYLETRCQCLNVAEARIHCMYRQDGKFWPDAEFINLYVPLQKAERQEWKHKLDDYYTHSVARIKFVL